MEVSKVPFSCCRRQLKKHHSHFFAVDPVASMQTIEHPALEEVAEEVCNKLRSVEDNV